MTDPLVSVVVTTYNQAAYIESSVLSAIGQTYTNLQIIVVDDGSKDDTPERLSHFADRVTLIRQVNRGVAASRNAGVRQATGDLIAFLDGDDLWEPEKIAVQVAAYQREPTVGLVAVDASMFNESGTIKASCLPWGEGALAGATRDFVSRDSYRDLLQENLIYTTSQVMIPTAVLRDIGPSNEQIAIASDYDLYLRIASRYPLTFVRRVLTRWRYLTSSASGANQVKGLRWVGEEVVVLKRHALVAPPEVMPLLRRVLRVKTLSASRAACCYGWEGGDRRWARRYLLSLWRTNPAALWPILYYCGLLFHGRGRTAFTAILEWLIEACHADGLIPPERYLWELRREHARRDIEVVVPPEATFILVDGDEFGDDLSSGRKRLPFLERNGDYWGAPADDAAALGELERLRRAGATFLVLAWPCFWWLQHYPAFARHVRSTFRCVLENERVVAFSLSDGSGNACQ